MRFAYTFLALFLLAACASQPPALTEEQKAFADTKARAEAGDVVAERELALMYSQGKGTAWDTFKAIDWLSKAADAGDAEAEALLGLAYSSGTVGVSQDPVRAYELELRAAKQGFTLAEYTVGYDYQHGAGTAVDYPQAIAWFKKASDAGDPLAAVGLGYMYGEGLGVPKDASASIGWYKLAAQRGNRQAQLFVALTYRLGMYGVGKDPAQAEQYYDMASQGVMHNTGEMVEAMNQIIDGHKTYPRDAAVAKQGGLVKVEFDCPGRKAERVRIVQSSGFPLLDAAARQAVLDSTFPERDPSLNGATHFQIAVNFDPTKANLPIGP